MGMRSLSSLGSFASSVSVEVPTGYPGDNFADATVSSRNINTFTLGNVQYEITGTKVTASISGNNVDIINKNIFDSNTKCSCLSNNITELEFKGSGAFDFTDRIGFSDCSSLTKVNFMNTGSSKTIIRSRAFINCAFFECRSLTDAYYCGSIPPTKEEFAEPYVLFGIKENGINVSCSDEVKVHVPPAYPVNQGFGEKKTNLTLDSNIIVKNPFTVYDTYLDFITTSSTAYLTMHLISQAIGGSYSCPCEFENIRSLNFKGEVGFLIVTEKDARYSDLLNLENLNF